MDSKRSANPNSDNKDKKRAAHRLKKYHEKHKHIDHTNIAEDTIQEEALKEISYSQAIRRLALANRKIQESGRAVFFNRSKLKEPLNIATPFGDVKASQGYFGDVFIRNTSDSTVPHDYTGLMKNFLEGTEEAPELPENIINEFLSASEAKYKSAPPLVYLDNHKRRASAAMIFGIINFAEELRTPGSGKEGMGHMRKMSKRSKYDGFSSKTEAPYRAARVAKAINREGVGGGTAHQRLALSGHKLPSHTKLTYADLKRAETLSDSHLSESSSVASSPRSSVVSSPDSRMTSPLHSETDVPYHLDRERDNAINRIGTATRSRSQASSSSSRSGNNNGRRSQNNRADELVGNRYKLLSGPITPSSRPRLDDGSSTKRSRMTHLNQL